MPKAVCVWDSTQKISRKREKLTIKKAFLGKKNDARYFKGHLEIRKGKGRLHVWHPRSRCGTKRRVSSHESISTRDKKTNTRCKEQGDGRIKSPGISSEGTRGEMRDSQHVFVCVCPPGRRLLGLSRAARFLAGKEGITLTRGRSRSTKRNGDKNAKKAPTKQNPIKQWE